MFQIPEYFLELVQQIVIDQFLLMLLEIFLFAIVDPVHQISEWLIGVELLHHRVDVADVSQIFKPCEAISRPVVYFIAICDFHAVHAEADGVHDHLHYDLRALFACLCYFVEQVEYAAPGRGFVALGRCCEQTLIPYPSDVLLTDIL